MKIAIMQPYFLPYIGAFQMINAVDQYLVYGEVNYRNDGWCHKNRMILKNQGHIFFRVAMNGAGIHKTFNDVLVDPSMKWRDRIAKTYELNYSKTKYYVDVKGLLEMVLYCRCETLTDFNYNSLKVVCDYLGIGAKLTINKPLELIIEENLRRNKSLINENISVDNKTRRIIEICNYLNADTYYNPIGGLNLYNKNEFEACGIQLSFLKTSDICYRQDGNNKFVPNLSIIDVISNCGKDGTLRLLNEFTLL